MPFATATELLDVLRQLHLLSPEQWEQLRQIYPTAHPDPRVLARDLIHRGWLTPYQGNQLLQDHGSGLLLGSYVLLEKLGEGGMGTVFKVRNWKLGQVVALKLIRKERLDNAAAVTRFQREIHACARLNHPHIVRAFDADEVAGTHMLVMEFVDGIDLARLVKKSGPLPLAQACEYIRQAALGLQHAHEHGLVHRDIKPSNLLLAVQGTVKILDLGLARMTHSPDEDSPSTLTESGAVMGTPDYLAPEQARQSHNVDIRADLYSLGCALYFLLTGKAPFAGGTLGEKLVKHQLDEPMPVEELRPEVPPEVAAVVRRLMAKKPEDRYQTPAELEQALHTYQRPAAKPAISLPIPAADDVVMTFASIMEPPSTAEAVDSPQRLRQAAAQRRRRWLNFAGGGVLLGMLGLFFLLLQRSGTATPEAPEPPPVVPSAAAGGSPLDALRREQISPYELAVAGGGDPRRAPKSLVAVLGDSRLKHWNGVSSVAFQPAGRLVASGGYDHRVRIWDSESGEQIRSLICPEVSCVAFSPDGQHIFTGDRQGNLKIWDAGTGQLKHALQGHTDWVQNVAFRPGGKQLASASKDKTVKVWDLENSQLIFTLNGHNEDVNSVAYSPDGKQLATGSRDQTIKLWDADQGGAALATLQGHTSNVSSVVYSPDGKYLASGGYDRTVRLWSLATRQEIQQLQKLGETVEQLSFSPDGAQLAMVSTATGIAQLLDARTGTVKIVLAKHSSRRAAFSKDGRRLAVGGTDGAVKLWDIATGHLLQTPTGHYGTLTQLAYSPDQRTVASSSVDKTVRLWSLETGEEIGSFEHPSPVFSAVWSPGGESLYSCGDSGQVWCWTARTRKLSHTFRAGGHNYHLAIRPYSNHLAVVGWVAEKAMVRVLNRHTGAEIHVWPLASGKVPYKVNSVVYSPDGKRLAAVDSLSGVVRVWDADSAKELFTLQDLSGLGRSALAFNPDSKRLVVPTTRTTLSVRDSATGEEIAALALSDAHGRTVAYSPDGRLLATCSNRGQLTLFNATSGKLQNEWQLPGEVHSLLFDATSRYLLTGNGNGTIYVLRLAPPPKPADK